MPPGNVHPKPPLPVIERSTAEACLAIAHRVQRTQRLSGDASGSEAARQIADGDEPGLRAGRRRDDERRQGQGRNGR